MRSFFILITILLLVALPAQAESLSARLNRYPNWQSKPTLNPNFEEVAYPAWMAGTWTCTSTLIDMVAPLAPDVTTPGFEGNRKYLNESVSFDVRFGATTLQPKFNLGLSTGMNFSRSNATKIVVDRVFNGLNIARAYLGDDVVQSVQINSNLPNEQLTTLKDGLELLSITTGHQSETPNPNLFLTSEFFQQVFRGTNTPFLNQVETTTKYQYLSSEKLESEEMKRSANNTESKAEYYKTPAIVADQYTAIYLSPQDPNYFQAANKPVALYRYRLELKPINT